MGLKYYLNLFKRDSSVEAVKLRYFLNTFVFLVYMVFAAAFFSMQSTDVTASSVFGILALAAVIVYRVLNKKFDALIDRLLTGETADGEKETDAAFDAYRKGYADFKAKSKAVDKKLFLLNIVSVVAVLAIFPVTIVLNLTGAAALSEKISRVTSFVMLAYFAVIFIGGAIAARKSVWYQNYSAELAVINRYKAANAGGGIKYKILEDKKPAQQLSYIFPDPVLRKRFDALQRAFFIVIGAFIFIFLVVLFSASSIVEALTSNEEAAGEIAGGITGGVFALWMAALFFVDAKRNKVIKEQYLALKTDSEKNTPVLKLHELRASHMKRWNILFLAGLIGGIASNILFAALTSILLKSDEYGWIFFFLFVAEVISMFVFYSKSFGRTRLKMIALEDEIDYKRDGAEYETDGAYDTDAAGTDE